MGSFHDHFRGSVVSEKCFTGFHNQASVVQVISVSKKKKKKREITGLKSQSLPMAVCFIGIDLLGSGIQTRSLVMFAKASRTIAIAHYG